MTRSSLALVLLVSGCSGARPTTVRPSVPRIATPPLDAAPRAAGWTRIAPRHHPGRIDDVAALSGGEYVVLSGTSVHRVGARGEVGLACELDPNQQVHALHAQGAGWWVLAGDVDAPTLWRGGHDRSGCVREALPSLLARDAPPATLSAARVGDDAFVWSSAGAMLRSRDGALTWRRLPPLPETVAVTVSDGTLYAAALQGNASTHALSAANAYALYSLAEGEARWAPASAPGDRFSPVALMPREGGGVVGVDVIGRFEVGPGRGPSVVQTTGPHFARDRPGFLIPVGRDAAAGIARDFLVEHRGGRWRPLPPLPDGRRPRALDAIDDGTFIVSDGHQLWRVRADVDPELVLSAPLGGRLPAILAASGPVIAMVSADATLAVTRDGGETWTSSSLPRDATAEEPRGLTVLPDGLVALITGRAGPAGPFGSLWVCDDAVRRVELPEGARVREPGGARLRVVGDRWLLLAGDVFVSDDQGARWRRTLSAPPGASPVWSVIGLVTSTGREVFALDAAGVLWRSDDAGDEFVATVGTAPLPVPGLVAHPGAWLAWDGGPTLFANRLGELRRYDRDGHSLLLSSMPRAVFGASVNGALLTASLPGYRAECRRDDALFLHMAWSDRPPGLIADACDHAALAFALDGDNLYLVDADGTIERASLAGLWRETAESGGM